MRLGGWVQLIPLLLNDMVLCIAPFAQFAPPAENAPYFFPAVADFWGVDFWRAKFFFGGFSAGTIFSAAVAEFDG